ncbi:hypothetical protein F3J17_04500 [Burkholderia sp. Ax-1719]|nr:hypothetical protein [Burkholderia sp. Ax-1719]
MYIKRATSSRQPGRLLREIVGGNLPLSAVSRDDARKVQGVFAHLPADASPSTTLFESPVPPYWNRRHSSSSFGAQIRRNQRNFVRSVCAGGACLSWIPRFLA